ncbi:probable ATP-dependent RNA helicase CG8611 [Anthonomus grandis grandis]|uniref:probable ATP-dependent RNA helicase CG8611 n=1 Tax=Anthonomus grandis grandis TaxID=2921223 RepID=UPI0021667E84|nr:probable ATP-dependent RNA helicase CG8611 [Anthonomus grandis grandis]
MTTFGFQWTDQKSSGTKAVFVKKRKNQGEGVKVPTNPVKSSENISKVPKKPINFNNNKQSIKKVTTPEDKSNLFIKRKGKKDKLKAKTDQQINKEFSKPNNSDASAKHHHSLFSESYKNVHVEVNAKGKSVVEKLFSTGKKFSELEIHRHLMSNLEKHKYSVLTNVQEKSIPTILAGKNCLIRSQTGSGKTLTYAIPILNTLVNITPKLKRTDGIQAIIVVPTRELALQTHELFGKLNTFQWIIVSHLCGGENRKTEKDKLRKGVHVLIATPGRLLDHLLHTTAFNAQHVKCLVLDEADRLLDMGFKKDIVRLVEELDNQKKHSSYDPMAMLKGEKPKEESENSEQRQTLLLSATLTKGIAELADFTMKDHVFIDALDESETTNPDHMIIPDTVKQTFILSFIKQRLVMLSALLISKAKQKGKTFVFMATTQMVDYHYELFKRYLLHMPCNKGKLKVGDVLLLDEIELDDSDAEEQVLDVELFKLHGSMNQQERKQVFNGFRKAEKGILICTDVVARGIDVPEADCIVQYTGPQSDDDYLHRVGRTGRAGKSGSSIIFLTHEEQDYISRLQQHKVFLKEHDTEPFLRELCDFMEEPDQHKAILALQRRYEAAISKDKELHKQACFAYSSWSRFYSAFPGKLKPIFDLKKVNVGHYVTSFGLKESPTSVAKIVRGQATKSDPKRLNRKLANHEDNEELKRPWPKKRPIKSISLTTSEFSSGLEPAKKKKKKQFED